MDHHHALKSYRLTRWLDQKQQKNFCSTYTLIRFRSNNNSDPRMSDFMSFIRHTCTMYIHLSICTLHCLYRKNTLSQSRLRLYNIFNGHAKEKEKMEEKKNIRC